MIDIQLDSSMDVVVSGRDCTVGTSDTQTVDLMMQTVAGEWGASVQDGIGLMQWTGAPTSELQSLVAKTQAGLKRNKISGQVRIESGELIIELKK